MAEKDTIKNTRGIMFLSYIFLDMSTLIVSSLLSIGFCNDLIKTIKSPFSRFEDRLARTFRIILISLVGLIAYCYFLRGANIDLPKIENGNQLQILAANMENTILIYIFPVLCLFQAYEIAIGLYSLYVAFKGLYIRKGQNKEI